MKRLRKTIAVLTLVSVAASAGGCSLFDDGSEAVLKAAEEYAEAVADADVDALEDILFDGEECASILEEYMQGEEEQLPEGYDDICAAIAGTITYEIDDDSLQVSKKDGKASVDITFEMVDYEAVYEEAVTAGGVDEFIDMLEDEADTIEVPLTVNFVLEDDAWLVKDKKCKDLKTVYAFYVSALEFEFAANPDALAAAEAYCQAVVNFDADAICAALYTTNTDMVIGLYDFIDHDPDIWGPDYDAYCSMIEDSFFYEIYPDSMEVISDDEVTVNVAFAMLDYEEIRYMMDDGMTSDEILRELADPDIGELWIPKTMTLVREDGQWYVNDPLMDDLSSVYGFYVDLIDWGVVD